MSQPTADALLRGMVEIESPSGGERELAVYLVDAMARLGFDSCIDGAGNAVGVRGDARGPQILLLGHMDTVSGMLPVRLEGSRLYGRGAVDAKGALATLICAAAQVEDPRAQLVVAGAVEEETPGSRGAHYLLDRYNPAAIIIGEPSGWSSAVIGYKGRMGLHYAVRRPPSHMAGPEEKATEVAIAFWNQLVAHFADLGGERSAFHRPIATLGRFEGDITHAQMDISCRMPPGFDFAAFEAFLAAAAGDASLHPDERTPAVLIDRGAPTVRALTGAIRRRGGQPTLKVKTGTSDMNIARKRWDAPMVAYGPGDSSLDHTDEEHVDLEEYAAAITVLRDALSTLICMLRADARP